MVDYRIRVACVSDAGVIAMQRVALFLEMGEIEHPGEIAALESATRGRLIEQIGRGEYVGWLAEDGVTVVGGAGVLLHQYHPSPQNLRGCPTAYVLNVYTDPGYRRRRIASRLMETITQWCIEHDVHRISLHASEDGRRLYERLGFAPSNEMRIAVRSVTNPLPRSNAQNV